MDKDINYQKYGESPVVKDIEQDVSNWHYSYCKECGELIEKRDILIVTYFCWCDLHPIMAKFKRWFKCLR